MLSFFSKYQTLILGGVIIGLFGYMMVSNARLQAEYERKVSYLTETIADMKSAQMQAIQKQHEYITKVFTDISSINNQIDKKIKDSNDEIEKWFNDASSGIDGRLQSSIERAIDSSRTQALADSRSAAYDIGSVLGQKFSAEISRELVEIAADAERTRIALGQCIEWSDNTKRIIEQGNKPPVNSSGNNKKKK